MLMDEENITAHITCRSIRVLDMLSTQMTAWLLQDLWSLWTFLFNTIVTEFHEEMA
jgi:hypothetical protein